MVFLTRETGTPTADVAEMATLVWRAWAPINQKYGYEPEPCPEGFLRRRSCSHRNTVRSAPCAPWMRARGSVSGAPPCFCCCG